MRKEPTLQEVHSIMLKIAEEHNKTALTVMTGEAGKDNFIKTCADSGMDMSLILSMITPLGNGVYRISNEIKP